MDDLGRFMDNNLVTIRWIVIGVGIAGAAIIGRSIRVASRFENCTLIPEQFFSAQVSLHGRVKNVEPDGILAVSHTPILRFPFKNGELGTVRVKLAGVGHTKNSISYLESSLVGKAVFFKLLGREDPDIAVCIVRFRKGGLGFVNLNVYLVKTGRAVTKPNPMLVGITNYDTLASKLRLMEQQSHQKGFLSWIWSLIRRTGAKN